MDSIALKANAKRPGKQSGFTMIELVIAIAISAVVIIVAAISFQQFENNSAQQIEIANAQLNLRGVLGIMEREFRMIGMDFNQSSSTPFGVTDIRRFSITQPGTSAVPDTNGSPMLRMTLDLNDNGALDADETITYLLYDRNGDGTLFDLGRSSTLPGTNLVTGRQLLAEGIQALGFVFAFDSDGDGAIDRTPFPGNNIIWAIDANNDNLLDSEPNGTPLGYIVPPSAIRAVQLSILARVKNQDSKYVNTNSYSVGHQAIAPMNDHYRRWLLTEILHIRNQ
jgi:type IV pilus assembly protein PilW